VSTLLQDQVWAAAGAGLLDPAPAVRAALASLCGAGAHLERLAPVAPEREADLEAAFEEVASRRGRLDGVFVGTTVPGLGSSLPECDLQRWETAVTVPLRACFRITRAALGAFLAERTGGRIVHLAHLQDTAEMTTLPLVQGLRTLVRSTAREYGRRGICCNLVVAGGRETRAAEAAAAAAVFLASGDASFVTGETIHAADGDLPP